MVDLNGIPDELKNEKKEGNVLKEAFDRWLGLFLVVVASVGVIFLVININVVYSAFMALMEIIKPVLYGCVIAYILNPLLKMYERVFKKIFYKNKSISSKGTKIINMTSIVLSLVTGILIIIVLCIMIIPQLTYSIAGLVNTLPDQINSAYESVQEQIKNNKFIADTMQDVMLEFTNFFDNKLNTEIMPWLKNEILPNINTFAVRFASGVAAVFSVLYNLFVGLIVAIYLLGSKRTFAAQAKKLVYGLFNNRHAETIIHYVRISNSMFSGFISGKIVDSTIIGILCFIAMSIMGLPYALLISVIVGVTNVIPVFGPYIGAVPSTLLILLVDPKQAVYFLILVLVIQQLDGNVIGPAILGESTGLSAFWVLFSILMFGGIFGIFGMLIGCPLFAVIYRIIKDFISAKLIKRQLLPETENYLDLKHIMDDGERITYLKYTERELNGESEKEEKKKNKKESKIKKLQEFTEKHKKDDAKESDKNK